MGHGIAQVLVRNGYSVILHDTTSELVGRGAERISRGLARDVEKGRLTAEEKQQAEDRLKPPSRFLILLPLMSQSKRSLRNLK